MELFKQNIFSLCAIILINICVNVLTSESKSENKNYTRIYFEVTRSYSRRIVMQIKCVTACPEIMKWKMRTSDKDWKVQTNVTQDESHKDIYVIKDLVPNTMYTIGLYANPNDTNFYERVAWTCLAKPRQVLGLYVARTGPGWLDIRWTQHKEKCKSEKHYGVEYKVENRIRSEIHQYGFFQVPQNHEGIPRPYHPCSTWPKEFCAILTDNVVPGKKHYIKVIVIRYDPDVRKESITSDYSEVTALADTTYMETPYQSTCYSSKSNSYESKKLIRPAADVPTVRQWSGIHVELWLVVVAGASVVVVVVIILLLAARIQASNGHCSVFTRRKHSSEQFSLYDYPKVRIGSIKFKRRIDPKNAGTMNYEKF